MRILRIKSKTTLQKLRDEGRIRFSQLDKKNILYDTESIDAFLEDFVYETFEPLKKQEQEECVYIFGNRFVYTDITLR
jgi:hypothetical protein